MTKPLVIVITGSTRGIGKGMALEFAKRGHHVVISGRSQELADTVARELQQSASGESRLVGVGCDVARRGDIEGLWQRSIEHFGNVDVWINNAGVSHPRQRAGDLHWRDIQAVQQTNLTGVLHATQVALAGMSQQAEGGAIYNMEGFGSNGMSRPGMSLYGASKFALTYFNQALLKEIPSSPVKVCYLSPGIVITDLLKRDMGVAGSTEFERTRKVYEILADRVETVSPWLVEQMLRMPANGTRIAWLTSGKAARRFLGSLFHRRQVLRPADFAAD
jgi:short-subunit dehydrogenase